MLAANQSAYEISVAIGPFYLLSLFFVVYFVVLLKMFRGPKTWKIVCALSFALFGHLMHKGATVNNFIPTVIDSLLGGLFNYKGLGGR